jgi:hypothetical protein
MQQQRRYNTQVTARTQQIAQSGFQVLEWRGIPIVADEKCTANYMFMLNTEFISLRIHPNKNFKFTGFKVPMNQDARAGQILLKCQITCNNRRMFYKWSNLAAT